MVLEEEPSSDPTVYDSTAEDHDQPHYNIDSSQLEHVPFFAPLLGYNKTVLSNRAIVRLNGNMQRLQRHLTQEEATALVYWTSRGYRMESWNGSLGFAAGMYQLYKTRSTWKYPLIKTLPDPDAFRPLGFTIARGTFARILHTGARGFWYGYLGLLFGDFFGKIVGSTIVIAGQLGDPRLKELNEETQAMTVEELKKGQTGESQTGIKSNPRNTGRIGRQQESPSESFGDDASPTGNQGMDGFSSTTYSDVESTTISESQSQERESSRSWNAPTSTNRSEVPRTDTDTDSSSAFFNDDSEEQDPASPTSKPPNSTNNSGSAWDRLRTGKPTPPSQEQRTKRRIPPRQEARSSRNEYTYSSGEEEKQLAREQAQKDFDALVDRERHGESPGETGRGRKW